MENNIERNIYYNSKTAFQSAERLCQKAIEDGLNVSRKQVKECLKSQDTYTRYKPIIRKYKYRQTDGSSTKTKIRVTIGF